METLDYGLFLKSIEPFNKLDHAELHKVTNAIDIKYFKKNETIVKKGESPQSYFIIAKGAVEERLDDESVNYLHQKDSFDAVSLLKGEYKNSYKAEEECIIFALKREYFIELIHANAFFESYYLHSISQKMQELLTQNLNKELATFMATRVKEAYIHPPLFIEAHISILETAQKMSEAKSDIAIIDFGSEYGIVTNTTLRERVLIEERSAGEPVSNIALKKLISIDESDFLFNALLQMIEHNISRLAVKSEDKITGVLEQVDLLSAISSKAHLTNFQINRAKNIEELKKANSDTPYLIKALQQKGVKVRHLTKLLSDLNIKTYRKLYELIAPKELLENSALMVLGSEGRKEQTLRTDQDNVIILRDGFEPALLDELAQKFTDTLLSFGYPKCEGNIMVSNPYWRKSLKDFKNEIHSYIHEPIPQNIMNLAIIFDASLACGDDVLFEELKNFIFDSLQDNIGFFAHFARGTLAFETPLSLFSGFVTGRKEHKDELDIKKGGLFPIVHGTRSLALEKRIKNTNTSERIKELSNMNIFSKEYATELIEGYNFLLTLRLSRQLEKMEKNQKPDNFINPSHLTKFERDVLRDVFKIVDAYKKLISHHFKLQMVS